MSSSNRVSSRISSFSSLEVAWIALSMALAIDLTESSIEHLVTDSAWCFDSNSRGNSEGSRVERRFDYDCDINLLLIEVVVHQRLKGLFEVRKSSHEVLRVHQVLHVLELVG